MKGVILAGGTGSRLYPLTAVTNKHLVPVGRIPMIEYPLRTLRKLDVEDITVVTGVEHVDAIVNYLSELHSDTNFTYKVQHQAGGIAQALGMAESSCKDSKLAVILGDNIFQEDFRRRPEGPFEKSGQGARVLLKGVSDPERFGVAKIDGSRVVSIEEKPKNPKSNLAVTGLYFYDETVFDKIRTLEPSERGELEITDVNNMYREEGTLGYQVVNGFWSDAGTFSSRERAEQLAAKSIELEIMDDLRENNPKLFS